MATYYVRLTGNDVNNGTSAATAWRTFGKALGAAGIASGDTVYVGAGVYREAIAVAMTSPTAETKVIGDTDGAQTGDAGEVRLTGFTTDDVTAPSTSTVLSTANRNFLTFERLVVHAGGGSATLIAVGPSQNTIFRDCAFSNARSSSGIIVSLTSVAGQASNLLVERCIFDQHNGSVSLSLSATKHTADYDLNIVVRNCLFLYGNAAGIQPVAAGSGAGLPGGIDVEHCTFRGGAAGFSVGAGTISIAIPSVIRYCIFSTGNVASLSGGDLGTVDEDWNRFLGSSARSAVNIGANSNTTNTPAMTIHAGQERLWGAQLRSYLSPTDGSPLLGAVTDAGDTLTTDILNRPRPSGAVASLGRAYGAYERHDHGVKEVTVVDAGPSLKIVGPGDHDFLIPYDAVSTTISVKCRFDTTHGTATPPQALLLANGENGVTAQTVTAPATADAWHTLTFSAFTPTSAGYTVLRLLSRPATAGGISYWDSVGVS